MGVRRLAVANGPNIFQMLLVLKDKLFVLNRQQHNCMLTELELPEDLGVLETSKPRQDAVHLELLAAVWWLRDHVTNSLVSDRLTTNSRRRHFVRLCKQINK